MRNMTGHECLECGGVIGAKDVAVVVLGTDEILNGFYHDPPCASEILTEDQLSTLRREIPCLLENPDPTAELTFGTTTVKGKKE